MKLSPTRWMRRLILIWTLGVLPVVAGTCTSDLLTGSLVGAADVATDIAFDGLRALWFSGDPGEPLLDYVLNVTETLVDESAAHGIDQRIPDDPIYD